MTTGSDRSRSQHRGGDAGAARLPAPGRRVVLRARGRLHDSGRIRAAAPLSRRAGRCRARAQDRRLSAADAEARHGGWPLFQDGDFDISATVKAYFALKMIGDRHRRAAHGAGARGDSLARRRRQRQCIHPDHDGAVRLCAVARGAGDAGRDHAVSAVVSVPPRQGFVLEPHSHRAAAGADEFEAAGAQSQEHPDRRAVPRTAGDARAGAEGAATERGAVLVLPRLRHPAAAGRAGVFRSSGGRPPSHARRRGSTNGSTARTGSARFSRPWPTP